MAFSEGGMTTCLGHNMVVVSLKDQVPLVTSQRVNSQNTQRTNTRNKLIGKTCQVHFMRPSNLHSHVFEPDKWITVYFIHTKSNISDKYNSKSVASKQWIFREKAVSEMREEVERRGGKSWWVLRLLQGGAPDGKLDWMWYSWVNCTWARLAAVCVAAASSSHINYRVTEPKTHAAASWADNPPSRLALRSPRSRCGVNKRASPITACRLNCEGSTAPEETLIWTEPPPRPGL